MVRRLRRWWRGITYAVLGPWDLAFTEPPNCNEELLMVVEIDTEGLQICCEEIVYVARYKRRWVPNRTYTVYKFTARPLGGASKVVRLAVAESVYFPAIGARLYGKSNAKQHMIRLFIEVVIQRARKIADEVNIPVI